MKSGTEPRMARGWRHQTSVSLLALTAAGVLSAPLAARAQSTQPAQAFPQSYGGDSYYTVLPLQSPVGGGTVPVALSDPGGGYGQAGAAGMGPVTIPAGTMLPTGGTTSNGDPATVTTTTPFTFYSGGGGGGSGASGGAGGNGQGGLAGTGIGGNGGDAAPNTDGGGGGGAAGTSVAGAAFIGSSQGGAGGAGADAVLTGDANAGNQTLYIGGGGGSGGYGVVSAAAGQVNLFVGPNAQISGGAGGNGGAGVDASSSPVAQILLGYEGYGFSGSTNPTPPTTNTAPIAGGVGGDGGVGIYMAAANNGAPNSLTIPATATVSGGAGGGDSFAFPFTAGGSGIVASDAVILNAGTITGGPGVEHYVDSAQTNPSSGATQFVVTPLNAVIAASGVVGDNLSITNLGTIEGGLTLPVGLFVGPAETDAIAYTGGSNQLTLGGVGAAGQYVQGQLVGGIGIQAGAVLTIDPGTSAVAAPVLLSNDIHLGSFYVSPVDELVNDLGTGVGYLLVGAPPATTPGTTPAVPQLVKAGAGTLVLTSDNASFLGFVTVSSGTLQLGDGGTSGSINAFAIYDDANLVFDRSDNYRFGQVTLGAFATGTLGSAIASALPVSLSGIPGASITGSGSVQQIGTGTTTLSSFNTYTGATTVSAGTLNVTGVLGNTNTTVEGGATFAGNAIFLVPLPLTGPCSPQQPSPLCPGAITVLPGGAVSPGDASTGLHNVGSLDFAGVTLSNGPNGGSNYDVDLGAPGVVGGTTNDFVEDVGNLVLAGTINVNPLKGFGAGAYELISYTGTLTNEGVTLDGAPAGSVLQAGNGQVNLLVADANGLVTQYWNGSTTTPNGAVNGGAGAWTNAGLNWTDPTGTFVESWVGGAAIFAGPSGGAVQVADQIAFKSLDFQTDGYSLSAANGGTLTITGATSITTEEDVSAGISAPIGGTGSLVKLGDGLLALTGDNTYSGGTTLSNGALQVDNSTASTLNYNNLGTGSLVFDGGILLAGGDSFITNSGSITANGAQIDSNGHNLSLLGSFGDASSSAPGSLSIVDTTELTANQLGTGNVVLFAANSYSGPTTVYSGTLTAGVDGALPSGSAVTVGNAADAPAQLLISGSQTIASLAGATSGIVSGGTGFGTATLTTGGGGASTIFAGTIQDGGLQPLALVKTGAGTMTLSGNSSYTGGTTIAGGTISTSADANLGADSGGLTFTDGTLETTGGFTSSRTVTLNTIGTIQTDAGVITQLTGLIGDGSDGPGALTKTGAGTLVLTDANIYGGGTTLSAGVLQLRAHGDAIGSGSLTFDGGVLQAGITSSLGNSGTITANDGVIDSNGQRLTLSGNFANATANVPGGLTVEDSFGGGAVTLAGTNTYSGATIVQSGTLVAAATGALSSASDFTVGTTPNAHAAVLLDTDATIGSLSGVAGVQVRSDSGVGAVTLTTGGDGASTSFAGVLADGANSTLGMTKAGAGTMTLSGASTYTGPTTASAGVLNLTGSLGGTAMTVADGASFTGTGATGGAVTVQSGGALSPGDATAGAHGIGTLTVGGLILADGANLNLDLGTPNMVGGATNDLVEDHGLLTLNGAVANIAAGTLFGSGAYRLIDYTGSFVDNGLSVSGLPSGYTFQVQTAIPGQVNLVVVNTGAGGGAGGGQGGLVQYWNGGLASSNQGGGQIVGGSGVWNAANPNWTSPNGAFAEQWASSVGVFAGLSGVVTLADTEAFQTLQFSTDGYVVTPQTGASLTPTGAATLRADAGVTATIAAPLTGSGSITLNDAGVIVLSGANTYTGGTTIASGVLQLGAGGASGSIVGDVTDNATLAFDRSDSASFAGVISGDGAVVQMGAGATTLTGADSYTGATTISAGVLALAGSGSIAASSGVVDDGGFDISGVSGGAASITALTGAGQVALGSNTLSLTAASGAFSGAISGAGGVSVGSGTQALSGTNGYTGATTIAQGATLALTGQGSIATSSEVADAGAFDISGVSGGGASIVSLSGAGQVALGANNLTLTDAGGTFSGAVDGSGGLTLAGGTETLSGTNGYTGATTIAGGVLALAGAGSIASSSGVEDEGGFDISGASGGVTVAGLSGAGQVTLGANTLTLSAGGIFAGQASGTGGLTVASGSQVLSGDNGYTGATTISGGNLTLGAGGTTGSVAGPIVLASGVLTVDRSNALTLAGPISGGGSLVQAGTGTTTLTGANSYTGATTVSAGVLQLGSGGASGSITGDVTDNATLAFDRSDTVAFAGAISGNGAVSQIGSGVLTLSGSNSYTGATTVTAGVLNLTGSLGATAVTVADGASFTGTGATGGAVTVQSGGALSPGDATTGAHSIGTLTVTGLTLAGGANLDMDLGAPDVVGGTTNDLVQDNGQLTLAGATTNVSAGANFGSGAYRLIDYAGTLNGGAVSVAGLPSGYNAQVQTAIAGQVNLVVTGPGGVAQYWDGPGPGNDGVIQGGAGVWNATNGDWTSPDGKFNSQWASSVGVFAGSSGVVTLADTEAFQTLQFSTDGYVVTPQTGASLTPTGAATLRADAGVTATIAAPLAGSGSITLNDAGVIVLSGANTYTGGTTVASGVLQLGAGGASGSIVGDVTDNATLAFDRSDSASFAGVISGDGAVVQMGAGATTLTGADSYTGATTISAGVLALAGSGSIAASSGVVDDGGFDISGVSGGAASITALTGAGQVALGSNTLSLTAASGAFSGAISGAGGVSVGSGTQALSGTNGYTGATTIAQGATLALTGQGSIATSSEVADAGAFDISGVSGGGASIVSLSGAGQVALGANNLTLTDAGGTFSGAVDGSGGLTLAGGTETLSGTNGYTGATTVAGGVLALAGAGSIASSSGVEDEGGFDISGASGGVTVAGLSGAGQVTLGANTLTLSAGGIFAGQASGTGGLTVASGSQVLSGDNSYTGATTISGGATLALTGSGSIATSSGVADAGTLDISGLTDGGAAIASLSGAGQVTLGGDALVLTGASGVFSGVISGSGLVALGGGTETLTGVNTYTGATVVAGGVLTLGVPSALSTSSPVYVMAGGTLALAANETLAELNGSGEISLGANTLSVGTDGASTTFSGSIGGSGGVDKVGGGELFLNGTSTYGGPTLVQAGILSVNGSIANSSVTVAQGATLKGDGYVGSLNVAGTTAPGNSIGTLHVAGDLTLSPSSVYQDEVNAAGASDLIAVSGKAQLNGAVQVIAAPGAYARRTDYQILTAAGGVSGSFSGLSSNYAFLTPTLIYQADAVDLVLINNTVAFPTVATSPNQIAAAAAANALGSSSALYTAISLQTDQGARQAFDAISGEIYADTPAELMQESRYVRDAVLDRLNEAGDAVSATQGAATTRFGGAGDVTGWGQLFGAFAKSGMQGGGNVASTSANTSGAIVGADARLPALAGRSWRAGLAVGYSDTPLYDDARDSRQDISSTHLAVYTGGQVVGGLQAHLGVDYDWTSLSTHRSVTFPGFDEGEASTSGARVADAFAELGYTLHFGRFAAEPFANAAYVHVTTDGARENGGAAALVVGQDALDGVLTDAGVRVSGAWRVNDTTVVSPYAALSEVHAFGDDGSSGLMSFVAGGPGFLTRGTSLDRDAGKLEAGATAFVGPRLSFTAAYDGQVSSHWQDQSLNVRASYRF